MITVAMVGAMASEAVAQPAVTEPWPRGEPVSDIQQIGGTLTAFMFGFGLGHAVEGRWGTEGWKFTVIDSVGVSSLIVGSATISSCTQYCDVLGAAFYTGLLVVSASRYFQIYDTAWGARTYNRRLEARRKRAGTMYGASEREAERGLSLAPVLAPTAHADGMVAGAVLQF